MNGLIGLLTSLTGQLVPASGTAAESLAELRVLIAAILIQNDAGLVPIAFTEDDDPSIAEAARRGAALAAERAAAGKRSRFLQVPYLENDRAAERVAQVFGPFIDGDAALVQFRVVDVAAFLTFATQADIADVGGAIIMQLPVETVAEGDLRRFTIPAGTVHVPASQLVPGATGFAMLRVSTGTLELGTPALRIAGNDVLLRRNTDWQLTVQPEAPPPESAEGSDGNAITLTLPSQLFLSADGRNSVSGALGIAGFGTSLRFEAQSGNPVVAGPAIIFPFATAGEAWGVAGHRSPLAVIAGDAIVQRAFWAVPVTQAGPGEHAEAAHGGMVGIALMGAMRCAIDGVAGGFGLRDPAILAAASGLELTATAVDVAAGLDLSLWGSARSHADFGKEVRRLRFHSDRNGPDVVAVLGGTVANRWDLPLAATGRPFGFEGRLVVLTLVAEPGGLRRTAAAAARQPANEVHGLALENFFLEVAPVRTAGFAGSGARSGALADGRARLVFDVRQGEPMLPDPYAASWPLIDDPQHDAAEPTESALAIIIDWAADKAPRLRARFDKPIALPRPAPFDAGEIDPGEIDGNLALQFMRHFDDVIDQDVSLLDLSTQEDHFGVAVDFRDRQPQVGDGNRIAVALSRVRLLMQPQVHWEPVQVPPSDGGMLLTYSSHGGRTLVGSNSVKLVPVLPGIVAAEIVAVAGRTHKTAALFSLPFGLRALAFLDPVRRPRPPQTAAAIRQAVFDTGAVGARQLRLEATGRTQRGLPDPARKMPGTMRQTANNALFVPPVNPDFLPPVTVLSKSVLAIVNKAAGVPLHAADLSGYGLSCFSDWHDDSIDFGVSKVRLDVMSGRTAYEVIEVRSVLAPSQARVVRTVILERKNSGRVERFDSGWQAIDDGEFSRPVAFDKGVVRALRRIRQIRELPDPPIVLSDASEWREVRFDADADIEGMTSGGGPLGAPALGHAGFVQVKSGALPGAPGGVSDADRLRALFGRTGPIGGPVDCRMRLGQTLDMHLSALLADFAPIPGFAPGDARGLGFAVGAYGMPDLPRAGQWSAIRIDGRTSDVAAVDAGRGVPVSRAPGAPYVFRDPAEVRLGSAKAEYGLLVTTPSSRVLFPKPTVDPGRVGTLASDPPRLADPLALVQASGSFPRAAFVMAGKEPAAFEISATNAWRLANPKFTFGAPAPDIASGGAWTLARKFSAGPPGAPAPLSFDLRIDSALPALPLELNQTSHDIILRIAKGELMTIATTFIANSDVPAIMENPKVTFGPILDELTKIVDALQAFTNIKLPMGVTVTVVPGLNPAFVVHLNLKFEVGTGKDGPIDIGLGKFAGAFELTGELQAAPAGDSRGRLKFTFQGAIQQAILPPLLYAGGLFHFAIEVRDTGDPLIELGLGTTTSIGGDLIKGLLEVEATIKYGYLLIPQTLQPGVMLGIEARAKLLAGLLSLSFGADAIARITRLNDDKTVTIFADIRVAASIQVAWLFDEDVDFRTQFEQNVPLAPLLIAANVNPLVAIATSAVL